MDSLLLTAAAEYGSLYLRCVHLCNCAERDSFQYRQPLFWSGFGRPAQGLSRYQSQELEGTMTTESRVEHRNLRRRAADRFERHMTDEIQSLRAALDIQFKRIAQIQAELDLSPRSVTFRQRGLLAPLTLQPKGNGHSHGG